MCGQFRACTLTVTVRTLSSTQCCTRACLLALKDIKLAFRHAGTYKRLHALWHSRKLKRTLVASTHVWRLVDSTFACKHVFLIAPWWNHACMHERLNAPNAPTHDSIHDICMPAWRHARTLEIPHAYAHARLHAHSHSRTLAGRHAWTPAQ
jgi:hypothetical protein